MGGVSTPSRSVSTRKPRTVSSSSFAQITATSAMVALVDHRLCPSSTHPSPSRRARVCISAGLDPTSGSVSPKQPIASPFARAGNQCSFCASLPYCQMGYITRAPVTEQNDRRPESPRSSSCMMRP
jgi:hypothetical protein